MSSVTAYGTTGGSTVPLATSPITVSVDDQSFPRRQVQALVPREGSIRFLDSDSQQEFLNRSFLRTVPPGKQASVVETLQERCYTRISGDGTLQLFARLKGGTNDRDIFNGGKDLAPNESYTCETHGANGGRVYLYTTWKLHVLVIAKEQGDLPRRIIHNGPFQCELGKGVEWKGDNYVVVIENKYETTTRHIAVHVKEYGSATLSDCVIA